MAARQVREHRFPPRRLARARAPLRAGVGIAARVSGDWRRRRRGRGGRPRCRLERRWWGVGGVGGATLLSFSPRAPPHSATSRRATCGLYLYARACDSRRGTVSLPSAFRRLRGASFSAALSLSLSLSQQGTTADERCPVDVSFLRGLFKRDP